MSLASSECFSRAELRYDRVGVVRGAILFLVGFLGLPCSCVACWFCVGFWCQLVVMSRLYSNLLRI